MEPSREGRWVDRLAEGEADAPPRVLDGATGTELERRGVRAELPLWSTFALLEAPHVLAAVHADYVAAGADTLTACTFRTQRRTLARAGLADRAAELTTQAVALAKTAAARAGDRAVAVLGSAPPLEDCFRPDLVPDAAALLREHAEHAELLAAAGADAILVETMNTTREALAALRAARDVGLPAVVCFTTDDSGRVLSGEALAPALSAARDAGAAAVGVNCLPVATVSACLPALSACGRPFVVYAHGGDPVPGRPGAFSSEVAPPAYATAAAAWVSAGAGLVGGCCGTRPAHVRAIVERLRPRRGQ